MTEASRHSGEVVDHYAAGGRTIAVVHWRERAATIPLKDPLVHGFPMTAQNRADLVAFLESLTDETLLHDPALSEPWPHGRR